MDISNRIFGGCVRYDEKTDANVLLPDVLITNLILFDRFVMVSALLSEFPLMVETFGFEAVMQLLSSEALEIRCEATQIVNMGSTEESLRLNKPYQYQVSVLTSDNHRNYLSSCFDDLHVRIPEPTKRIRKMKEALLKRLDLRIQRNELSERPEIKAAKSLVTDLNENASTVRRSVHQQLYDKGYRDLKLDDLHLRLHRTDPNLDNYFAESNLEALGVSLFDAHDAILQGILTLGGIKQTFQYMSHYSAICTLHEKQTQLIADELNLFAELLSPKQKERQFVRILDIKGLPRIDGRIATNIKLDRVLELRETREIREFRTWLLTIDEATDAEVKEHIENISNHIGTYLATEGGKTIRVLVAAALGAVPVVGPITGLGASFIDSQWLEKIFPASGPISFVNDQLPSIFPSTRLDPQTPLGLED